MIGTGKVHFTTAGPWFLSSSGPLGSPWQPLGSHLGPRRPPWDHKGFRAACGSSPEHPRTFILELSPACRACFHFSTRPVILLFWITFGNPEHAFGIQNHPPGPFCDPGGPPLGPLASLWTLLTSCWSQFSALDPLRGPMGCILALFLVQLVASRFRRH